MIDLKVLNFSSTVPAEISASPSFSEACMSFLTVDLYCVSCDLPDWHLVFPHFPPHLVLDLILTWSVLQLAHLVLLFRKSDRSCCHAMMYSMRCQCLDLVDLLELEVAVGNEQLVFCADG